MKKKEFAVPEYPVNAYKEIDCRQNPVLEIKKYLTNPDCGSIYLIDGNELFPFGAVSVECFRQEIIDLCDAQIGKFTEDDY